MSKQMSDPYLGMLSYQEALRKGMLAISLVPKHKDLYSHFDEPTTGVGRLTYARLDDDKKKVRAFLSCVLNGFVDGFPCVAVGYAVPEEMRNQGLAKQILEDVVRDQLYQAGKMGVRVLYVEAVIDIENLSSQRVAEAVFNVDRESITDSASGRPAFRYTTHFDTASGRQL